MVFRWPSKSRIPWLLAALALMSTSAYSVARLFAAAAAVGALTGVPEYARQIFFDEDARAYQHEWIVIEQPALLATLRSTLPRLATKQWNC